MRRVLKLLSILVLGLVVLIAASFAAVVLITNSRMEREFDVDVASFEIPEDAEAIERGRHKVVIRGCGDCHGEDYGGKVFIDDPAIGRYVGTNLTSGEGGIGDEYDVKDWVRAVRHGVGPEGHPLRFMPSPDYEKISDEDLSDMIAYLRSVEPVDSSLPETSVGPLARVLYLKGDFPLLPAESIDHSSEPAPAPPREPTAEYGEYLSMTCIGCHGKNFSGGPIPGTPPEWPPAANITPHETGLAGWTKAEFVKVMRTGVTPDGKQIESQFMPWKNFRHMTDAELAALWKYIQSIEPVKFGER